MNNIFLLLVFSQRLSSAIIRLDKHNYYTKKAYKKHRRKKQYIIEFRQYLPHNLLISEKNVQSTNIRYINDIKLRNQFPIKLIIFLITVSDLILSIGGRLGGYLETSDK